MSVKVQIIKVIADGEQLSVEASLERRDYEQIEKGVALRVIFDPYFKLIDDRALEMNRRVQAAGYYQKKLAKLSPDAYNIVNEIWDILHGKRPGPAVDEVIEWDRLETLAAIEEARLKLERAKVIHPSNTDSLRSKEEVDSLDELDNAAPSEDELTQNSILKDVVS